MKMKISFLLLTLIVTFTFSIHYSFAAGKKAPQKNQEINDSPNSLSVYSWDYPEELLQNIFDEYKDKSRFGLDEYISQNFTPSKFIMLNEIEDDFDKEKIINVSFSIKDVVTEENLMAITFDWEKQLFRHNSSELSFAQGSTTFVFVNNTQQWLLYNIEGDNPFTIRK